MSAKNTVKRRSGWVVPVKDTSCHARYLAAPVCSMAAPRPSNDPMRMMAFHSTRAYAYSGVMQRVIKATKTPSITASGSERTPAVTRASTPTKMPMARGARPMRGRTFSIDSDAPSTRDDAALVEAREIVAGPLK